MSDIADRVKEITAETLKIDKAKITDDARFVEDLGAESVQSIELVAAFEEAFEVELDEDEALGVKTVGDAVTHLERAIEEQG